MSAARTILVRCPACEADGRRVKKEGVEGVFECPDGACRVETFRGPD